MGLPHAALAAAVIIGLPERRDARGSSGMSACTVPSGLYEVPPKPRKSLEQSLKKLEYRVLSVRLLADKGKRYAILGRLYRV